MSSLAANALTTVADVKESLGVAAGNTSKDNLITRKINQVSNLIEKYCDRVFKSTAYVEYYDGSQIDEIVLNQRPIDTVQTFLFERRDTSLNETSFETIQSNLYFIDVDSGVIETNFTALGRWDRYRITYTAGYSTTPADLAEACVSLVCFYIQNASAINIGKYQVREGQKQITYQRLQLSFKTIIEELGIDQILDAYANSPVLTDR